ncbi:hypothetical protein MR764_07880 [Maribellus sp. YY47]|nr:hypothetical protein [Maribellus sp. YY47]
MNLTDPKKEQQKDAVISRFSELTDICNRNESKLKEGETPEMKLTLIRQLTDRPSLREERESGSNRRQRNADKKRKKLHLKPLTLIETAFQSSLSMHREGMRESNLPLPTAPGSVHFALCSELLAPCSWLFALSSMLSALSSLLLALSSLPHALSAMLSAWRPIRKTNNKKINRAVFTPLIGRGGEKLLITTEFKTNT